MVFWELRQQWLEELYRHHVASARITDVLDLTNSALGDVCTELGPALQARFAAALLQACAQALEWVLLDGGPCRCGGSVGLCGDGVGAPFMHARQRHPPMQRGINIAKRARKRIQGIVHNCHIQVCALFSHTVHTAHTPRWYTPADVQLLEQDMGRLKELFHAGGHGLPK